MIDRSKYRIDPKTGCWLWNGSVSGNGYGKIKLGRKQIGAHRVAFKQFKGLPIPAGMCVCHTCDTPACINPDHLWLGTHADNMRDMHEKGRNVYVPHYKGPSGERARTAKLNQSDVLAIRASRAPTAELAKQHGVTARTILMIRAFETWKHLPCN